MEQALIREGLCVSLSQLEEEELYKVILGLLQKECGRELYAIDRFGSAHGSVFYLRIRELVTTEIPKNTTLLKNSVKGNLKGTAIATLVSDEITGAATQMAALYPFMQQLVTSGSYNVTGSDGSTEKHKVNLLSSAERYYVANEVVTRLERINTDLFILAWQVRTLSWNDLWFSLDPEGWASVMSGKNIINGLVTDWSNIKYY